MIRLYSEESGIRVCLNNFNNRTIQLMKAYFAPGLKLKSKAQSISTPYYYKKKEIAKKKLAGAMQVTP
jgi:hypothetical protein